MLPDYRFCALLMTNLLVYSIRTCKLLTSATGLRSSMATYTNRYYDIMVFYFVLREGEREREVFNYTIAILILDHSLEY